MPVTGYYFTKIHRIINITITLIMIMCFIIPSFTAKAAVGIPQPLYPPNYADTTSITDPPLGVPSFSWSTVSGTSLYKLQVASEIGFNNPINLDINTPNTSFTPSSGGNLFADGQWYWRVRVEQPETGVWSEIMRFTKTWATDENKPILLAPTVDDTIGFFNAPDFSWTRVIGASIYRFQIATSPDGFASPILTYQTLTNSIQPEGKLENGDYWWRVIPVDIADHVGTSSEVRKFTMAYGTYSLDLVPTQLEPADETFPTFTPTFHWTAVEGAEHYRLEFTSAENCNFTNATRIDTVQTSYTPTDTFPNDARYCWRVRADSGPAVGDWSDTWHFQKKWYLQPELLTPRNLYQNGLYPMYSWTPVPGAARYYIEIAENPSFSPVFEHSNTANTTYTPQAAYIGTDHYYWRVTPYDGGGRPGLTSDVWEYQSYYDSTAPVLVYPLYYYLPNDYGIYTMNPVEDRTVAFPIFIWHRVMTPAPNGGVFASAYRIQVDTTPYFNTIIWEYDTENTSASPIDGNDFVPQTGQDYYWRVCVLDYLGGNCSADPRAGWSQIWKTRFDLSRALPPTNGDSPALLRPANGQESVEATPLLEWWPYQDATQYQVEISRDADFSTNELNETVNLPAYSPEYSLAQRSLGRTDYGTFYWRVRAFVGDIWGEWSDPWRFQIASQSEWKYARTVGNSANKLLIGEDPPDDAELTYDLTNLYTTQSNGYWFLGFNGHITLTNMTYVFYLDLDHVDGSGATTAPERPYNVTTIPAHQPEFAVYVDKIGGVIRGDNTWVYAWDPNSNTWNFGQRLSDIGGQVFSSEDYAELQIPNGAIGMDEVTSSASIMLYSVDNSTNELIDSVPSDIQVPGNAQLSRFSSVSDHMNLVVPQNTASGDITTIPSLLPFYWDWPTGSQSTTPFGGSILEVHLDPKYTSRQARFEINSNTTYFSENNVSLLNDIVGDNIYYWRVQPKYWHSSNPVALGAWTSGWSFRRLGFTPQNLQTSIDWATPTFSWDMVEGASVYHLQVATDPNFGSIVIDKSTPLTSFTPEGTLAQGNYFWRLRVNRYPNIWNDWSEVAQFNLTLPTPTGLSPNQETVHYTPTFCWDPLIKYNDEPPYEPILSAWKYRVEVSRDENFSIIYDSVTTFNNCWTPISGYFDGTYWWHVAMIDGYGRQGSYSSSSIFTKQYPVTTLISPIGGAVPGTPTFIWTPVDGAATYKVEISRNSTFSPLYDGVETINTEFTPTKIYESNKVYYWRVAIRDRQGREGPFTDATIIIGVGNYWYLPLVSR